MTPPPVYTQASGHVLTIVLARPEKRNAVDRETANALRQAFSDFEADDTLKVAVLWGEGGNFCAGADLEAVGDPERRNEIEATGTAHVAVRTKTCLWWPKSLTKSLRKIQLVDPQKMDFSDFDAFAF